MWQMEPISLRILLTGKTWIRLDWIILELRKRMTVSDIIILFKNNTIMIMHTGL